MKSALKNICKIDFFTTIPTYIFNTTLFSPQLYKKLCIERGGALNPKMTSTPEVGSPHRNISEKENFSMVSLHVLLLHVRSILSTVRERVLKISQKI